MANQTKTHTYEVVVGNVGTIYCGSDKQEAEQRFDTYMHLSMSGYGRVANEPVTMLADGEIYQEFEV